MLKFKKIKGLQIKPLHKPTIRVVEILSFIAQKQNGANLTQISDELMLPKSTISPILKTLVDKKFIHLQNLKYKIGVNSFKIGSKFLDNLNVIDMIKSHMQTIVNECNEICQLGILDNCDVVYIAKVDPIQPIQLSSSVGNTLPANCTALGKILLSAFDDEQIQNLYQNGLSKLTQKSITNMQVFLSHVKQIKHQQFAFETGESNPQIQCLAVPLFCNNGILAAMSVSIPLFRSNAKLIEKIKSLLIFHSKIISQKLSHFDISIV